jgi:hypothetical protein
MSERDVTADQVRDEHLQDVDERAHWLFLVAVLVGGVALMLGFIALLGAAAAP